MPEIDMKLVTQQMVEDLVNGGHNSALVRWDREANFWWQYALNKTRTEAEMDKERGYRLVPNDPV